MGATKFTSHYDLPQFVASDKPSWLGDVNDAFLKIDTAIAGAASDAEAASTAASSAQTQVANLSGQLGTIEGKADTAVNTATEASGKATTAQESAQAASVAAGQASAKAEAASTTATAAQNTANAALPVAGGTMTGALVLKGAPESENEAATKAYVDSHVSPTRENLVFTKSDSVSGFVNAVIVNDCLVVGADFTVSSAATSTIATIEGDPLNIGSVGRRIGGGVGISSTGSVTFIGLQMRVASGNTEIFATGLSPDYSRIWLTGVFNKVN